MSYWRWGLMLTRQPPEEVHDDNERSRASPSSFIPRALLGTELVHFG